MKNNLTSLADYHRKAVKAVFSILFFIFVYFFLVLLAVTITIICSYGGIMLMSSSPGFITLMLGLGLIGFGFMLLFFLIKFLFTSNKVDRSGMIEITEKDQPKLFQFVRTTAQATQAPFPKRIYLTSDVNASVFYDSNFWSMIFPVQKNLVIGLGLVNCVNISEFKAILAHEFGHFSQRTMKIGSYVYNVNHVIYNMLYENEGYNTLLERWANLSGYFAIFAQLAVQMVKGIQWILQKTYNIVNLSYMGLSREMEFQADMVAASVAGSEPLITSLNRLDLAGYSYSNLLNFYNEKISDNVKTNNIYLQHTLVMHNLAETIGIETVEGLPHVTPELIDQLNQSKIVIKDQWASHPSTTERSNRLRALDLPATPDYKPAWDLFINQEKWQERMSNKLFEAIEYAQPTEDIDLPAFNNLYFKDADKFAFNKKYNGFYDNRTISPFDIHKAIEEFTTSTFKNLEDIFDKNVNTKIYAINGLSRDINVLEAIQNDQLVVKNFDYDGLKYKKNDTFRLLKKLRKELELKTKALEIFETKIFQHFYALALPQGKQSALVAKYEILFSLIKETEGDVALYVDIMNALQFVNETTPYDEIRNNLIKVAQKEIIITKRIRHILADEKYQMVLSKERRAALEKYVSEDWIYFEKNQYDDNALEVLFEGMHCFFYASTEANLEAKRDLLNFQIAIAEQTPVAN